MNAAFGMKGRRDAQTLIFFLLAFGTIFLLCGLAIDSGLLYLAKARLSRAVDGAALEAVGNFSSSNQVLATDMRNFAVANFTDLQSIDATPTTTSSNTSGTTTTYDFNFNDHTTDPNGQPRRFVDVVLTAGSSGQITSATCNARCPVQTYFIGYADGIIGGFRGISSLKDLKVSSSAVATRNPRLIMIVVDRSSSMLMPLNDNGSGGAFGLPQSIVVFLNFFETGSDSIGIVSFSSNARLEMPLTTNFLYAATNNLIDSYSLDSNAAAGSVENGQTYGVPGIDPEMTNSVTAGTYATGGVRRLKFGGDTAADDGMRMALECLMSNSGFNNPDVVKYIVLFTDGRWNNARTLLAAPTYTNWVVCTNPPAFPLVTEIVSNTAPNLGNNMVNATNLVTQPSLTPMPYYTNALNDLVLDPTNVAHHANDYWLSLDTNTSLEPLPGSVTTANPGGIDATPTNVVTSTYLGTSGLAKVYTTTVNVWLQPGAVDYLWSNGAPVGAYLGDLNTPTNTVTLQMVNGESNELVVPGYVLDGVMYDGLDLTWEYSPNYYAYRWDNFNSAFMWPDDQTATPTATDSSAAPFFYTPQVVRDSFMRSLVFRNYANLLTGFYVFRPSDPLGTATEPLTGALRPLNGLGPYYPSAAVYWPFDLVGFDWDSCFPLANPLSDPDTTQTGESRRLAWTINMLSASAAPQQAGELFYQGTGSVNSGSTAQSTVMSSAADWQGGAPTWLTGAFGDDMTTDTTLNTNIAPNPKDWRPSTFRGSFIGSTNSSTTPASLYTLLSGHASATGGYVVDSTTGDVYNDSMCWNGRPTHYYNFANSTWQSIYTNHNKNVTSLPLGYWKAEEYAWHARASNVTVYTVGYGVQVADSELVILAQMANATNVNTQEGTNGPISYLANQPVGQQYYADSTNAISNDFYSIAEAINAALTQ